ncbi:unnamed protein product [Notodromas monacha]|uniref:Annexin n=1 Tax=Notodromas monacha TaxID=399045 RepID=A0A7R9G908_9CRUS|nr:unnamed protein product [Notodromas monacha]CAG0912648.1 unnamed protein product [Notodromas monacha]
MAAYPRGTITPARNFDAEGLCNRLRKAMKGLGTDEKAIIDILSHVDNRQRQELKHKFKAMFGKDLVDELKSELGGNFESVVLALMEPPLEYLVSWLNRAMKGLGTNEYALIEILCGRPNQEIMLLKQAFRAMFGKDLDHELKKELSGDFEYLMRSTVAGARDENPQVDFAQAQHDAQVLKRLPHVAKIRHALKPGFSFFQALYQAGVGKNFGTDESTFITVLNVRSYNQLREIFSAYHRFAQHTIEEAIKKELSGAFRDGMLAIVQRVQDPPTYFASRLYTSMKGAGTDDGTLIRVVVSRSELDLAEIKQRFQQMYGVSLGDMIKNDTKGDYRKMLMAIVDPE